MRCLVLCTGNRNLFGRCKASGSSTSACHKNCPVLAGNVADRLHIGFDDPDAFTGPEDQVSVNTHSAEFLHQTRHPVLQDTCLCIHVVGIQPLGRRIHTERRSDYKP